MDETFLKVFGHNPEWRIRCPGRVNLIGEHIDYNGYGVFPMALGQSTTLLVGEGQKGIRIRNCVSSYPSRDIDEPLEWTGCSKPGWTDYVLAGWRGTVDKLGIKEPKAMDMLVNGEIPSSAGLSSSSALVCASALATLVLETGDPWATMTKEELATLCMKAENLIGTMGGGMDQAAEILSQQGKALRIDFNPLKAKPIQLPDQAHFVVLDSGVRLNKGATSQYNERVVECRLFTMMLSRVIGLSDWEATIRPSDLQQKSGKSFEELVQLAEENLPKTATRKEVEEVLGEEAVASVLSDNTKHMTSFVLRARALHVFTEASRVEQFEKACEEGDISKMGQLMHDSHRSCSDDYECSCPELDKLVDDVIQNGAHGARLTGAGWGGCVVALVDGDCSLGDLPVLFHSTPSQGITFTKV